MLAYNTCWKSSFAALQLKKSINHKRWQAASNSYNYTNGCFLLPSSLGKWLTSPDPANIQREHCTTPRNGKPAALKGGQQFCTVPPPCTPSTALHPGSCGQQSGRVRVMLHTEPQFISITELQTTHSRRKTEDNREDVTAAGRQKEV